MEEAKENRANDVLNEMLNLTVEEDKVEEEFEKDFGPRLRLAKGALLIQEIGNRVHCSIITVAKAMVLFHKLKKNGKFDTSCVSSVACLNLAIKLCEEDVSPDEMVLKSYHATLDFEKSPNPTRPDPSVQELNAMKKNLYLAEYAICRSMSFKLECAIAHTYVYKFLAQIQSTTDASEDIIVSMSSAVTKLLCTYYLCEGCLDFTADEIAWACLQFAFLYCGILSPIKYILRRELASLPNKDRICQIMDELVLVSDVSVILKYI